MESLEESERLTRREMFPRLVGAVSAVFAVLNAKGDERSTLPDSREQLSGIERDCLRYFLDNQTKEGLFLDRQRNRGALYEADSIACSTSATGMGFIALALAAQPEFQLLDDGEARIRCAQGMLTALEKLPADHGILPHFVRGSGLEPWGHDVFSTIDSTWLIAGAGCTAELLDDDHLRAQAAALYGRVDWRYWTNGDGHLLSHGKDAAGKFLCNWDRLNGETSFMYVMAAGAESDRAITADSWAKLNPHIGEVAGLRFASADLGLFTSQFGNELLDLNAWQNTRNIDLLEHARLASRANILGCTQLGEKSETFRQFWGASDGDRPGKNARDEYCANTLQDCNDGTANIMASIAAIQHEQEAVLRNIEAAEVTGLRGRYAYNNVNLDKRWIGADAVGIDVGNAGMALDNALHQNRIRHSFHALAPVEKGLQRFGFRKKNS